MQDEMSDPGASRPAGDVSDDTLYRRICESMTSGVMLVNAEGKIETCNRAAATLLGMDREAVIHRGFGEVFLVDDRLDELNEALLAAIHDGETRHHRVAQISVGERTVPLSVSTVYLRDRSGERPSRRGVVAVFSDISEVEALRVSELRLKRDLEARHKEVSEAYVRLEERNRELGSLGRKVLTVRIAAAVFVLALVAAVAGYLWSEQSPGELSATAEASAREETHARIVTVEPGTIASAIVVASAIKPRREVVVTSPVDGQIERVHVRQGEAVDAGQPLLKLDMSKERIQRRTTRTAWLKARIRLAELSNWADGVEAARARRSVNKARIALEAKEADIEETKFLVEHGLVPSRKQASLERDIATRRLDLEAAERELKAVLAGGVEELEVARLELANAKDELERIDRVLDNATVLAPVAGVVLRLERRRALNAGALSAGSPVEQGQKLLTVGDLQGIAVTGWVDEANVRRVRTGHAVRISGPAFPDMELEGRVVYVSSEATPAPGRNLPTFEVTAVVDRLDEKQRDIVRLGMSADMKIEVYRNDQALTVPVEAVDLAEDRPRLRVWDEATAAGRMVYVVTGTTTTDSVEILSGIAPGDRVVVP